MHSSTEMKTVDQHYVTPIDKPGSGSDDVVSDVLSTESHDKADMERLGKRQELRVCGCTILSSSDMLIATQEKLPLRDQLGVCSIGECNIEVDNDV